MKNLFLASLLALIVAPSLSAMWFLNKTNEPRISFILSMSNRKNTSTKTIVVRSFTRKNVSFSEWQSTNQFSRFRVIAKWNSGVATCGNPDGLEADTDNYNAVVWRDPVTNAFRCEIRVNPPLPTIPE